MSEQLSTMLERAVGQAPGSRLTGEQMVAAGRARVRRRRAVGVGSAVGALALAGAVWLGAGPGMPSVTGTGPAGPPAQRTSPVTQAPDLETWHMESLTVGVSEEQDAWVAWDPEQGEVLMDGRVEGPGVVLPMEAGRVAVVRVGRESAMEDGIRSRPGTPITTSEGSVLSSESQGTGGVSLEDGPDPGFAIGVTWLRCDGHVEDCITGMDTTGDGVADTPMSFQPLNVDLQRSIDVAGRLELARTADGARALLDGRELERAAGERPGGVWAWELSDGRVLVVVDTTREGGSVRVDPLLLRPGGSRGRDRRGGRKAHGRG